MSGQHTRAERIDWLRRREAEGKLSGAEAAELEALFRELDTEEQVALESAREQSALRQAELLSQNERLVSEIDQLQRIRGEHESLLSEARTYLEELRARHAFLADEYRRVTGRELTAAP